ncbi:right-handed parallel beta-helix repeat-containing protein [Capillimicrobium parvum]|uniref:Right handed beta helix domain-containing protein n=1 Tax=Capillimicrobium parvum TaxID=2884022 RepID=A0A9E7BX72_9ACTN|nr:right-handed parallel beta-helix repeat-containing protein [Capillimicrobium parvum]UGS34051.1 hypothetical protein DSM104329_00422 [Capillimicrobium parvum]
MRTLWPAAAVAALLLLPAAAGAHPERQVFFPDGSTGAVPEYRTTGPSKVVCKPDSAQRIRDEFDGGLEAKRLRQLARCSYHDIQAAVNAASSGDRILIMPGVYHEEPSLAQVDGSFDYDANQYDRAKDASPCRDMYQDIYDPVASGLAGNVRSDPVWVPTYEHHRSCPNHQNLIAIAGDDPADPDRVCDDKCNLQIEGMGRTRADVVISGSRRALNVIRADRADGIYLSHFTVELSDFNNIYVLETNGFRIEDVESRYSREYGVLSFTSDHGLYDNIESYGAGDSGVYPGSGPEGHCARYGIELRHIDSHDNTLGYSGTAGNGIWVHDSKFHHNATGLTTDSFAFGHPGMPQDCAKFERNEIYSNNNNVFDDQRDAYCRTANRPVQERDPTVVCPTFQAPVGTGIGIFGGNGNIVRDNWIYDNWRDGAKLLWVPANFRGESDPSKEVDTSFDNLYRDNHMGVRPDGTRDPNGNDFWWDEEGRGNCWMGNAGPGGAAPSSNVLLGLPGCPGAQVLLPGNPAKTASQATCSQWDPQDDLLDDPPGCDWFTTPKEPS